jgi:hypothetical protein
MNMLLATVVVFALALDAPKGMQPRVLMGDTSHCDAVMVRNGHITIERVCTGMVDYNRAEVAWDGHAAVITDADEKASADWIRSHSLLPRLSTQHHDLYWDGKKVDLGKVDVLDLYKAIPWQGGVLIYGRTIPRRGFWESWPFKWNLTRDMEPFCAIYFDPNTLKGEDFWINGLVNRGLFVFPIPD